MRKYSLGFFMVLLAISLASFTKDKAPKKYFEDFYWFSVPGSIANGASLTNAQVSYLNAHQPSDPAPADCPSGSTNYCHVGFRANQVTVSGSTVTVNGSQIPTPRTLKP